MSLNERELKRYLRELSEAVTQHLADVDALVDMRLPNDAERGRRLAKIANALDLANDRVRYFALGVDYRTDSKRESARKGEAVSPTGRAEA